MPTNKNAQLRYQILDRCFSNMQRYYSIGDLMDEINEKLSDLTGKTISLRQVRDDIKYMRDRVTYDAPITAYPYDGKKCYYRYSDPNFSIFKNELSYEELTNLRSTIEMLGRYRGTPANAWLEEVISNLEYRFGVKPNTKKLIAFEQNEKLKGLENLSGLIDATMAHQPIKVDYQSFKGNKQSFVLHPYYVKSYNGRWFIFGLQDGMSRITNLALDRINSFSNADIVFIENTTIDFDAHFKDIIGVTVPNDDVSIETIVLKFAKHRFPYVVSKPIHSSQVVSDKEDCIIEINVKPNQELNQQIFSYIPDVEVIAPQWYREDIRRMIENNLKLYSSVHKDCTGGCDLCNCKLEV